jgi:ATP-dependent DNA ligase
MLSETLDGTPADLVRVAKEFSFEGILAKRADSVYESGKRSGAWLKYRVNQGQEFVIGGYVPDHPLDSLIAGCYHGDRLLYIAKVRNGFVSYTRRAVAAKLRGLEIDTCPFANLPEKKCSISNSSPRTANRTRIGRRIEEAEYVAYLVGAFKRRVKCVLPGNKIPESTIG